MIKHILRGFKKHHAKSAPHQRIFNMFYQMASKMQKAKTVAEREKIYKHFSKVTPEHILETLHKFSPELFPFNPVLHEGFNATSYMPLLCKFLGVRVLFVDVLKTDTGYDYYYSYRNQTEFFYGPDMELNSRYTYPADQDLNDALAKPYDMVCAYHISNYTFIPDQKYKMDIKDKRKDDEIVANTFGWNKQEFLLDSCGLTNFENNFCKSSHMIAGVICNKRKYVYNGWITMTRDAAMSEKDARQVRSAFPCELMRWDWNQEAADFCLNPKSCKLDTTLNPKSMCFSFDKGDRYFLYINQDFTKPRYKHKYTGAETLQVHQELPNLDEKQLQCVRQVANWASLSPAVKFDSSSFDPQVVLKELPKASPKLYHLLKQIRQSDDADMQSHKRLFKHFIFSELTHGYGAKIIASALIALGYELAYDKKHKLLPPSNKPRFALLSSSTVYGEAMTQKTKKAILAEFNKRPDNSHGRSIQIIILDAGFKEGIDLFDVKYVHIFEPQISSADQKQVIGRATRYCGQKGLRFDNKEGWPLHVNIYDSQLSEVVKDRKFNIETMHELYMSRLGIDLRQLNLASDLERLFQQGAVDYELNRAIHGIKRTTNKASHAYRKLQLAIDKKYSSNGKWNMDKFENMCDQQADTKFSFKPHQEFMRHYISPKMPVHGILVNHSVGSGKTCSAIAAASSSFEKEGYTVLWVTRTTLKADLYKNMFDQVCNVHLQDKKMPKEMAARKRLLSKAWQIPPMSYKQFTNMLQGKNEFYKKLVSINGREDPLKNTFLIIDEAHKLFNAEDLKPIERPDVATLKRMLHHSYTTSGKSAVKMMMMTATPITNSPMDCVKLMNLIRAPADALPEEYDQFAQPYLTEQGKFTKDGAVKFMNAVAGSISYLDMAKDGRHFALPQISLVKVPISTRKMMQETKEQLKIKHKLDEKQMEKQIELIKLNIEKLKTSSTTDDISLRIQEITALIKQLEEQKKNEKDKAKKKEIDDQIKLEKEAKKQLAQLKKSTDVEAKGKIKEEIEIEKEKIDELKEEIKNIKKKLKERKKVLETDKSQERMMRMCMQKEKPKSPKSPKSI